MDLDDLKNLVVKQNLSAKREESMLWALKQLQAIEDMFIALDDGKKVQSLKTLRKLINLVGKELNGVELDLDKDGNLSLLDNLHGGDTRKTPINQYDALGITVQSGVSFTTHNVNSFSYTAQGFSDVIQEMVDSEKEEDSGKAD